ncbi:RDD family protein [Agriterribacter humi]|jgi:uncharacterized RDD family membrane protein YckC|uniref:RDD family protein n=1 Tax=Agriterribacter humi TaxID=1104781 RepID=UPI00126519BB|nr:RDD family protein [Agriterribacter humi]
MDAPSTHLLTDIETTHIVQAGTGKRFANYIIDVIVFYIVVFFLGMVVAVIDPSLLLWMEATDAGTNLLSSLISLLLYGIIMGITEAITGGRSLGKLITGTRAVNADGSPVSMQTAFWRGLCRAVPFEAFSALGAPSYPWHDKWTNTYVIDIKQSVLNQ